MSNTNGSTPTTKACNPFCEVTIPIEQDGCPEHDGQDAQAEEQAERQAAGKPKADTSSFEAFTAGMTDEDRRISRQLVQNMVMHELAKREKNRLLNPPTGWADLKEIRSQGRPRRIPPSVMPYATPFGDDEIGLFYPAAINTVFGNAEVGKSLLNYATHAWFINQGKHTVHMDFDNNSAVEVFWRVVDSGADIDKAEEFLHVAEMPGSLPAYDFEVSYVSLDCVNSAIAFMGGEANSSGSGTDQAYEKYLTPFVLKGACAVALDHVGHSDKTRASNSIRKIQAVSGIAYCMEAVGDGGKMGEKWYSKLTPTKDRPGGGPAKGLVAAYIEFDGTVEHGRCEVTVMRELVGGDDPEVPADIKDQDSRLLFGIVAATVDSSLTTAEIFKAYQEKGGEASLSTVKRALGILRREDRISGEKINPKLKTSGWKYWAAEPEDFPAEDLPLGEMT